MTKLTLENWPYSSQSHFLETHRYKWHYQICGEGAKILLIHGTGASTHSWRPVLDALGGQIQSCAIDLPGHGFSQKRNSAPATPENITEDLAQLLERLSFRPQVILGHSAGAVIAVSLARYLSDTRILAVNAAFGQFSGFVGAFFSLLAQAMSLSSAPSKILAKRGRNVGRVENLLASTGSKLDERQIALYHSLFQDPDHIAGVLKLMSDWDITCFLAGLPECDREIYFLCGERDRSVSPDVSRKWASALPHTRFEIIKRKGHLLHEEAPNAVLKTLSQMVPEYDYCERDTK